MVAIRRRLLRQSLVVPEEQEPDSLFARLIVVLPRRAVVVP
jgi:hypothetical protein